MEVIDYNLKTKNPVLITHAISRLLGIIKRKFTSVPCQDVTKIDEYKYLLSKCNDDNPVLITSICHALVSLAESEILTVTSALCTLISYISITKNYVAITISTSQLLLLDLKQNIIKNESICTSTIQIPEHPFIRILKEEKKSWRTVLHQMHTILNYNDERITKNGFVILNPVFMYILCDPSLYLLDSCKEQTWKLLMNCNDSLDLQIEILSWLCTNELNVCIDTNSRILEFAEASLSKNDEESCTAIVPLISSLAILLLEHGYDPEPNFSKIIAIVNQYENIPGDILIALMSEIILICPAYYLYNILQICTVIVNKDSCNVTILYGLVSSLLKWIAYPSVLCSDALVMAESIANKILTKKQWSNDCINISTNKIFKMSANSNAYIQFYTEVIHWMNTWMENDIVYRLNALSKSPVDLLYKFKIILCGLFLQNDDFNVMQKVCDILLRIGNEINSFASHLLSLVMHKLTRSSDSNELKYLLLLLPKLVIATENIPVIINIIDSFYESNKSLKYFALVLYLKMQDKNPRCYKYLSSALIQILQTDSSMCATIICAKIMKQICERRPERATEFVPSLSQILNKCIDANGSTATALALNGISALCKFAVVGICSTWKVLAPKMRKEKRTIVLESLCEFFGNIPSYPTQSSKEYDRLITDVVEILWTYIISNDLKVSEAALKALASYKVEQIPLYTVPSIYRCNLPEIYNTISSDEARNQENALLCVPGICWIQMLQKINKGVLSTAGNVLISFIETEINGFRSGIYNWPYGEPKNFKYLPDKSVIRAVGECLRRSDKSNSDNQALIIECLRIFAHKYPKPLPNINWEFLQQTAEMSHKAKEYSLIIACLHACTSLSARTFVERYLSLYKAEVNPVLLQKEEFVVLYLNLGNLCKAMQVQNIKPFLESTLDYVVENREHQNQSSSINLFREIMNSYFRIFKNDEVIECSKRSLLVGNLEKLFNAAIDLTNDYYKPYIDAILELPYEHIERITSPSVWWTISMKMLKNSIIIRAELILRNDVNASLNLLTELIDTAAAMPDIQMYLLEEVQKLKIEMCSKTCTSKWTSNFLNHIMAKTFQEDNNKAIFYCDILFISLISLSGVYCFLANTHLSISSQSTRTRLFPQAVALLANKKYWKDSIIPQLMKWLHRMETSSLPDSYKSTFHNSLISLRHHPHYNEVWTNYLSIQC